MKTHYSENEGAMMNRRQAEHRLAHEVGRVLAHTATDNLHWQGSRVDLIEALHTAYTTFLLTDDEGVSLSFIHIVSQACSVLHVAMPSNPYELAARGSRRKGLHSLPYMTRYLHRLQNSAEPLWEQIEKPAPADDSRLTVRG
ncbi:MAG: hypothetical protein IJV24_00445 [Prevotella sp.]|nr:hypothetical protein [Prevotella sp.]